MKFSEKYFVFEYKNTNYMMLFKKVKKKTIIMIKKKKVK